MSLHHVTAVPIDGNLTRAVLDLLKQIPIDANNVTVVIPVDGLHSIEDATIMGLPIQFAPTFGKPELVGTVRVQFGLGVLE